MLAAQKSFQDLSDGAVTLFQCGLQILLQLFVPLTYGDSARKVGNVSVLGHFILLGLKFLHDQCVVVI